MALFRMKSQYRKRGGIDYYGITANALSQSVSHLAATSVKDYALFAGGVTGSGSTTKSWNNIDAYDNLLVRNNTASLSSALTDLAAAHLTNYAAFGGGHIASGYSASPLGIVNVYDNSLTRTTADPGLTSPSSYLAATKIRDDCIAFGGGGGVTSQNFSKAVDIFMINSSGVTKISTGSVQLKIARQQLVATSVGDYALFGGGYGSSGDAATVDAFNSSFSSITVDNLSQARQYLAATTIGNYALFGGGTYRIGSYSSSRSDRIDVYDTSLTRTNPITLSVGRANLAATSVKNYAIFAGGSPILDNGNIVDIYDKSLVRINSLQLSVKKSTLAAATIGNYALFGGGSTFNTVEVFKAA